MSDTKQSPLAKTAKTLCVLLLKVLAVGTALICRCTALLLSKISDLLEKMSGHGTH